MDRFSWSAIANFLGSSAETFHYQPSSLSPMVLHSQGKKYVIHVLMQCFECFAMLLPLEKCYGGISDTTVLKATLHGGTPSQRKWIEQKILYLLV
jgi:hypothetical protein